MLLNENQFYQINKERYMQHVDDLLKPSFKFDLVATLFGSLIITLPFGFIYSGLLVKKANDKFSDVVSSIAIKSVCTDKYGRDNNGLILNSAGLPKNPQTADDLPTTDITNDRLVPSPIDQHGTCGVAF